MRYVAEQRGYASFIRISGKYLSVYLQRVETRFVYGSVLNRAFKPFIR